MDKKNETTSREEISLPKKCQSNYNTEKLNSTENHQENFSRLAGVTAHNFKNHLAETFTKGILLICAEEQIVIDAAGVILLQKFFRKFVALWTGKKSITLEKLHDIFFNIFHKYKHCTQTKDAVLVAGDLACGLCAGTSLLENIFAQVSSDCGKEV